ncbi:hypothetical protein NDN01_13875 [Sphingomonas sp. QA11]|uniref:hypothetical protein n=1 Tax=Sphingomonas sp. QA11 TaxID=2950605 RepID=UPI00234A5FE0|nr:hypothetical protein [Sphingomonas sp. QA11]WCM25162.1 hypothetical protein NDN01_13875 [Sphingomonas sp. QA11]
MLLEKSASEVNAMKYRAALGLILVALIPGLAQASDTYSGKIAVLQVNDTGAMHFRVALNTTMTNCDLNFAFVEKAPRFTKRSWQQ